MKPVIRCIAAKVSYGLNAAVDLLFPNGGYAGLAAVR